MNDKLPYSYHTFLFPFIWNNNGKQQWNGFEKVLSVDERWVETSWKSEKIPDGVTKEEWLYNYAAFQYFTGPANNAIFNTRNDNVVRCFEYHYNGKPVRGNGRYVIKKGSGDSKDSEHWECSLKINGIRLNVYEAGIAILILELENREYYSLADVCKINEYGRRINLPYITPGASHNLCADQIELYIDDTLLAQEDYYLKLKRMGDNFDEEKDTWSLNFVMKPIRTLLDNNGEDNDGRIIILNKKHEPSNEFYIRPCIDDRMFVCCLVLDTALSNEIKGKQNDGGIRKVISATTTDHDGNTSNCDGINDSGDERTLANRLYKLFFIENSLSCQNPEMKRKILEESVYLRWSDYGTIHAATHHSFMAVATADSELKASVYDPFLTEYVQMAVLVLAQRSVILMLSSEAADMAGGLNHETEAESENIKNIKNIERLQTKYVRIQSQLLLSEATVQEQGVELYELLRKNLYIQKNKDELAEHMNNLRDVADISNSRMERDADQESERNEKKMNNILAIIAVFSLPLAVFDTFSIYFSGDGIVTFCKPAQWTILALCALIAAILGIRLFKKPSKKTDKKM